MKSREERYGKDRAFKRLFYKKLNEILDLQPFDSLDCLQYHIEYLIGFCEQIDGKEIYQPLRNYESIACDLDCFLYGLMHWPSIKELFSEQQEVKQVDIIKTFGLDKAKAGNFFYILSNVGVLNKTKSGRYNVYSLVSERLDKGCLETGWPSLFDPSKRLKILDGESFK